MSTTGLPGSWPRLRLALFDLDGTLVDSAPDIAAAVNELLAKHGLAAHPLSVVRGMIGHGIEKLVERAFAAHGFAPEGDKLAERHTEMMGIYCRHLTRLTALRDGASEAVGAARRMGLCTGVVTNKPEGFSRTILAHFGMLGDLDMVIGGDSGFARKPAPDMLMAACRAIGCDADEAFLVGDSEADLAAARAAGIACILVRGGYARVDVELLEADLVIDDLRDFPALLVRSAAAV